MDRGTGRNHARPHAGYSKQSEQLDQSDIAIISIPLPVGLHHINLSTVIPVTHVLRSLCGETKRVCASAKTIYDLGVQAMLPQ